MKEKVFLIFFTNINLFFSKPMSFFQISPPVDFRFDWLTLLGAQEPCLLQVECRRSLSVFCGARTPAAEKHEHLTPRWLPLRSRYGPRASLSLTRNERLSIRRTRRSRTWRSALSSRPRRWGSTCALLARRPFASKSEGGGGSSSVDHDDLSVCLLSPASPLASPLPVNRRSLACDARTNEDADANCAVCPSSRRSPWRTSTPACSS